MRWRSRWPIMLALGAAQAAAQAPGSVREAMQGLLVSMDSTELRPPERAALDQLYVDGGRPIWVAEAGGPTLQASAVLDALAASDERGLPSTRYDVPRLRALAADVIRSESASVRFDVAMSRATVRFLADVHLGRIDPHSVDADLPDAHERLDLTSLVRTVATASNVSAVLQRADPPYAGYRALVVALARYRALADDRSLHLPARPGRTIHIGDPYAEVAVLARLLLALGDLDSIAARVFLSDSTARYDSALAEGVTRFQRRVGLDADGVIGPATIAALRVPPAYRVRQLELALERWRWLSDEPSARSIVVNIPAFRLEVLERDGSETRAVLTMNVIVGQAEGRHDTPVFAATLREVVFQPYWDVPARIARRELLPLFRTRPGYFEREGFEIVRRLTGDDTTIAFPPTSTNLARVLSGDLRLRQRPGPTNALGAVKFVFPNRYNVFLHDTPAKELFAESRRDFSHGCIRIERPADVAELVLRDQSPWSRPAIDSAMAEGGTIHVSLARPLPVVILYSTAAVDSTGIVRFYPDLYGRDAVLERALRLTPVSGR